MFQLHSNFESTFCNQTVEILIGASDLGLHRLPVSDKKDARHIWVNALQPATTTIILASCFIFDLVQVYWKVN